MAGIPAEYPKIDVEDGRGTLKRSIFSLALAAALLVAAPMAHGALIHLFVNLNGANEVPSNAVTSTTAGTGTASFDLDTTLHTLHGVILFSGLTGTTTASHIHCCLASPFANAAVGVATVVPAFPGFPLGVQSGTDEFTLQLNNASAYNPAFVTAQGGLINAEAAFVAGLTTGRTYLNIHTTQFGGGEIRGFVVPEPMTISLFALGLAAAGFVSRRRKPM